MHLQVFLPTSLTHRQQWTKGSMIHSQCANVLDVCTSVDTASSESWGNHMVSVHIPKMFRDIVSVLT